MFVCLVTSNAYVYDNSRLATCRHDVQGMIDDTHDKRVSYVVISIKLKKMCNVYCW